MLRILTTAGADLNHVDNSGRSFLLTACARVHLEAAMHFIEHGAEVRAVDSQVVLTIPSRSIDHYHSHIQSSIHHSHSHISRSTLLTHPLHLSALSIDPLSISTARAKASCICSLPTSEGRRFCRLCRCGSDLVHVSHRKHLKYLEQKRPTAWT